MCSLEKRQSLFILKLTGTTKPDQEHRLSPTLISSIRSALSQVRSQAVDGSALITLSEGRFFSNGFDLMHARAVGVKSGSPQAAVDELLRMVDLFRGVVSDLISLPMPTIAAVTGHASAAGLILAMSHDYVMMNSSRSVLYMSELDIGMTLPDYFTALIRGKLGSASVRRGLLLRAEKVKAEEAVAMGIVDSAHDGAEEVVAAAIRAAEEVMKKKWNGKAYAGIRIALYPEVCGILGVKEVLAVTSKL